MNGGMSGLPSPDPRDDQQCELACFKQLTELIRESYLAEAAMGHGAQVSRGGTAVL